MSRGLRMAGGQHKIDESDESDEAEARIAVLTPTTRTRINDNGHSCKPATKSVA